ncbi:MAG: hypothetical protein ACRDRS_02200 [Pseudonocardiaceae bacterium]
MSMPAHTEQTPAPSLQQMQRCDRSVPALHLLEADDTLIQPSYRVGPQVRSALCGAEVTESTPVPDYEVCPGCADCVSYCADCARVAAKYRERPL